MVRLIFKVLPAGLVACLLTAAAPDAAFAQSACKGLSHSQCTANAACAWVDTYTTKAGKKVNAYCRNKSGNSAEKSDKK